MNTVTDLHELCARVVTDRQEIDRMRWFQLRRYFDGGIIDEMPTCLPYDPSVAQSTYFAVYAGDELHACARLINSASGLPVLEHGRLYPRVEVEIREAGPRVAEVSRLAVGRTTPHHQALGLLAREMFRYCLRHQHTTELIASIEKPLVRILNQILGIPVEIIGDELPDYGNMNGACVPVRIDTVRYLTEARWRSTRRWEFFTEDLVIDLTSDGARSVAADASADALLRL